jgi:hypothetical protein
MKQEALGGTPWLTEHVVLELLEEALSILGGRCGGMDVIKEAEQGPREGICRGVGVTT